MSCSCRALSVRAFVQGLAQVHRLEALAAPTVLQLRSVGSRPVVRGGQWVAARQSRGLQTSRYRSQESAAAAPAPEIEGPTQVTAIAPSGESSIETHHEIKTEAPAKTTKRAKGSKKSKSTREGTRESLSKPEDTTQDARQKKPKRGLKPKHPKFITSDDDPIDPTALSNESKQPRKPKEHWQIQKAALKEKFPDGWKPRKRLSPDALAGIRALNAQFPDVYTTEALASKFEVSAEAIRRILKSKWKPNTDEVEQDRQDRWFRRGLQVWEHKAALGIKPPRKWRKEGVVRDPAYHEWSRRAAQREREWEEGEIRKYKEDRERIKRQAAGTTP